MRTLNGNLETDEPDETQACAWGRIVAETRASMTASSPAPTDGRRMPAVEGHCEGHAVGLHPTPSGRDGVDGLSANPTGPNKVNPLR
jgi:hypothetical protein